MLRKNWHIPTILGFTLLQIITFDNWGYIVRYIYYNGQRTDPKTAEIVEVVDLLKNIDGIGFAHLTSKDVVRHKLVREIIDAYEAES